MPFGSWPILVRSFPSLSLVYTSRGFCRKIGPLTDVTLPWHTRERNGGSAMTFEEILDQFLAILQRRGRVTSRTLPRQFNLDDAGLEDLTEALLYAHPHVADDPGHGLPWRGDTTSTPPPVSSAPQPAPRLAAEDFPHVPKNIGHARVSLRRYGAHRDKTFMGGRGHAAAHQI